MALVSIVVLILLVTINLSLVIFFQCYSYKLIIVKYARKFKCYCKWCDKLKLPVCCAGKKKAVIEDKQPADPEQANQNHAKKIEDKTKNKISNSKNKIKSSQQLEKINEDFDEDKVSEKDSEIPIKNDNQLDSDIIKKNHKRAVQKSPFNEIRVN